jgi:hypothetical protein
MGDPGHRDAHATSGLQDVQRWCELRHRPRRSTSGRRLPNVNQCRRLLDNISYPSVNAFAQSCRMLTTDPCRRHVIGPASFGHLLGEVDDRLGRRACRSMRRASRSPDRSPPWPSVPRERHADLVGEIHERLAADVDHRLVDRPTHERPGAVAGVIVGHGFCPLAADVEPPRERELAWLILASPTASSRMCSVSVPPVGIASPSRSNRSLCEQDALGLLGVDRAAAEDPPSSRTAASRSVRAMRSPTPGSGSKPGRNDAAAANSSGSPCRTRTSFRTGSGRRERPHALGPEARHARARVP